VIPTKSLHPSQKSFAPTSSHGLNILLQANLDGDTAAICLALGPMIASSAHDDIRSQAALGATHKLSCMCSLFKLLQNCEMCKEGNIANIDALLGCPIYCHEPVALDQFVLLPVATQIAVCTSIFFTINWFVGAFLPRDSLFAVLLILAQKLSTLFVHTMTPMSNLRFFSDLIPFLFSRIAYWST
jgi:hypothetical protein